MVRHYKTLRGMIPVAIIAACLLGWMKTAAADAPAAVIFAYQRIDEDSVAHGNLSLERFREHIQELRTGGYHVLPLPDIIAAMQEDHGVLPEKTVGITFDGAYLPTINTAAPLLRAAGFPFTVFFSSDQADAKSSHHMSFDQLKDLKKDKLVTLGILPAAYAHLTDNPASINKAVSRYREVFSEDPQFFSWPYGEYSTALKRQIASYSFKAVFGQHAGVVHPSADFSTLPRFMMTGDFGDLEHFRLTANSLPLPVSDVVPEDAGKIATNPPMIGFTVTPEIKNLSGLACFASGVGRIALTRAGGSRIELRLQAPLEDRRTRINCTLPTATGAWRWFGMLLVNPASAVDNEDEADPDSVDITDTTSNTE